MKKMISKKLLTTAVAGAFVAASGTVIAGTVGTMNTFTSGTPAVAADVNDNFTEHTAQINDNAGQIGTNSAQISAMQNMAATGYTHTATVDCSTQTIADVAGAQPAWGELVLTITGTCNENLLIDIRGDVTLKSTTGAVINGADGTSPTIEVRGQQRIKLVGITITGGWSGVSAYANSEVLLKNVTINAGVGPGLEVRKNSSVTIVGNQDVTDGSGPSTGTTTIVGGTGGDGIGVLVASGGVLHVKDGTAVINSGATGMAAIAATNASIKVNHDRFIYTPTASFTGNVMLQHSGWLNLDGYGNSSITGNLNVNMHSSAVFNGASSISGGINLLNWGHFENSSSATSGVAINLSNWSLLDDQYGSMTCTADSTSQCLLP